MPLLLSSSDLDRRISIAIDGDGKRLAELNSKEAVTSAPGFDGRAQVKEKEETKFTKGPWHHRYFYNAEDGVNFHLRCGPEGDDGGTILEGLLVLGYDDTNRANAHLIDAAPDLYQACEEALDQLWHLAKDPDNNPWVKQLRAALSKARGE